MVELRRVEPGDWEAVAAICADTGAQGEPVGDDERTEFAERWVGPYRRLRPDWTFVAVEEGRLVGYLTGSPDTLAFEEERRRAFAHWTDAREFFPMDFRLDLWARHPAHLHMNFSAGARGKGYGRRLIDVFYARLKVNATPSAHVICGERASGFWRKAGFSDLRVEEPFPGVRLHAMIRRV